MPYGRKKKEEDCEPQKKRRRQIMRRIIGETLLTEKIGCAVRYANLFFYGRAE